MKIITQLPVCVCLVFVSAQSTARAQDTVEEQNASSLEGSTAQPSPILPDPDPMIPHAHHGAKKPPRLRPFMQLGLMPTYAFRAHSDERSHGLGAQLYGHFWIWKDIAIQVQGFGMAFNDSNTANSSLSLFGGASTLLYNIEEGGFTAHFGAGPVVASSIEYLSTDDFTVLPWLGTVFQFGVGADLGTATRIEASARCPLFVFGKDTPSQLTSLGELNAQSSLFPFQVSMGIGLVMEPWKIIGGIQKGEDPFDLLLPSF